MANSIIITLSNGSSVDLGDATVINFYPKGSIIAHSVTNDKHLREPQHRLVIILKSKPPIEIIGDPASEDALTIEAKGLVVFRKPLDSSTKPSL